MTSERCARIDVVVPTRDRPDLLARCLAALREPRGIEIAVYVVDDGSVPPVGAALPADVGAWDALHVLRHEEPRGPGAARNAGVAAGAAPFVAFVDDDVRLVPDALRRHLAAVAGRPRTVSIGTLEAPPGWHAAPWLLWEAETLRREYERMLRGDYAPTWRQFHTGNAMLRRADFEAAGGFREDFTRAEDIELGYRLHLAGCGFVFQPAARGLHEPRRTAAGWLEAARRYGEADVALDRLYPELGWLDTLAGERRRRHPALRRLVRALDALPGPGVAARLGPPLALGLARTGATGAALRALSVAYEVRYREGLRAALAAERRHNPSPVGAGTGGPT